MEQLWPWLVVAGLGASHGVNPAMGWPFAAALGLEEGRSRSVVLQSLLPIATGHAASVAIVAAAIAAAGIGIDSGPVRWIAGCALLGWGLHHLAWETRHRIQVGVKAGFAGLAIWSFLMATVDGAGLMLVPALVPLCLASGSLHGLTASGSIAIALAVVSVHTVAMLVATGATALVVHGSARAAARRYPWIDLDRLWVAALLITGALLISGL
jgi:hypothetical protein